MPTLAFLPLPSPHKPSVTVHLVCDVHLGLTAQVHFLRVHLPSHGGEGSLPLKFHFLNFLCGMWFFIVLLYLLKTNPSSPILRKIRDSDLGRECTASTEKPAHGASGLWFLRSSPHPTASVTLAKRKAWARGPVRTSSFQGTRQIFVHTVDGPMVLFQTVILQPWVWFGRESQVPAREQSTPTLDLWCPSHSRWGGQVFVLRLMWIAVLRRAEGSP